MKFTCLSEGRGYHFPPCHIVDLCGLRVLLDCPLDLSSLSAFAPVPSRLGRRQAQASDLGPCIYSTPWYKTVDSLQLWDVSFINVVLISSGMGMLGLPFLTRAKGFSAKIYATEVTMKLGQLMMNDLISMHREFKQTYGPDDPYWMKWEELDKFPSTLKEALLGKDGSRLGGWSPLYSTGDVKGCIQRVQPLRYGEEACYNGTLVITAVSSGLDIGTSNWTINTPKQDIAYVCNSVAGSAQAMDFDYRSLQARDVILYSDLSSLQYVGGAEEGTNIGQEPPIELLPYADRAMQEELEKVSFICSCAFDAIRAGGSVLLPIGRLGVILQLLEQLSTHQELSSLKVPIFMISSVSEELLSLFNVVPEWLSRKKQERLFAGEPLFAHVNLLKEEKLHLISDLCSPKLLKLWREPCIVFCPHWSLRLGPAVHLVRRWRGDENSLLVLDQGTDADLALLPFKPMKMKVLQSSFLSGIRFDKIMPLMSKLQPAMILLPGGSSNLVGGPNVDSISLLHYSENETVRIPRLRNISELEIDADLASQFQWKTLEVEAAIARLKGQLSMDHGKRRLVLGTDPINSIPCRLHWGTLDIGRLLAALEKAGINASVDQSLGEGSDVSFVVNVAEPNKALMEVKSKSVVISTDDQKLASLLFEVVDSILGSI